MNNAGAALRALIALAVASYADSPNLADRIFHEEQPDNANYPTITYQMISAPYDQPLTGRATVVRKRYQVDIWSDEGDQPEDIAEYIKAGIIGYRGTIAGVEIQEVSLDSYQEYYEDDIKIYRMRMDFFVGHSEVAVNV